MTTPHPVPGRELLACLLTAALLLGGGAACSSGGPAAAGGVPHPGSSPGSSQTSALTVENGYVADGDELSPFADVPAVTGLDAALRTAVQDAARDATADGVPFHVSSGWRSAAYQQELFDEAVRRYGSPEAARAVVLPPGESAHVSGHAVDIGPTDAMSWLQQHGSDHGLCQTYANEMWHFQLTVEPGVPCPAPAPDASGG